MKKQPIREFLLGGPGHDGYVYKVDVYCVGCGRDIITDLYHNDYDMLLSGDTDDSPQPIFFGEGESDEKLRCAQCGEYLYGESNEEETDENDDCETSL
jgi:hypothetical protein